MPDNKLESSITFDVSQDKPDEYSNYPTEMEVGEDVTPEQKSAVYATPVTTTARGNTPAVITNQFKVGWYDDNYERIYGGTLFDPAEPRRYTAQKDGVNFIPQVNNIYKKYNVPIEKGDWVAPARYFSHNIPLAVMTDDGRIIKANDNEEFAVLLYQLGKDGGVEYDPDSPMPTQNYTYDEMKRAEDEGEESAVRQMLYENVRAGNLSYEDYRGYQNGAVTLDELYRNSNYALGTYNNNPSTVQFREINVQDYFKWLNQQRDRVTNTQAYLDNTLRMITGTYEYLLYVQDVARANYKIELEKQKRKAVNDPFGLVEDGDTNIPGVPEIPDNWMEWETIPDEWKILDKNGNYVPLPVLATYSPKAMSARLQELTTQFEEEITSRLPDGYTATINIDPVTSRYTVRFLSPDGVDINGNPEVSDMAYQFTNGEIDEYKQWAEDNPDKYSKQMIELTGTNPALAQEILKLTNPEYTEEQVQLIISAGKPDASQQPEEIFNTVNKIKEIASKPRDEKGFHLHVDINNIPKPVRSYLSGIAGMSESIGGIAGMVGFEDFSNTLIRDGAAYGQIFRYGIKEDDLLFNLGSSMPMINALGMVGMLGTVAGAGVAGSAGLGWLGTALLETVGATALSRPLESSIEAGQTYSQAKLNGFTDEEADQAAQSVFWGNMALSGWDMAQFFAAFVRVPGLDVAIKNGALKGLFNIGKTGGKVGVIGLSEAGEELYQLYLQRIALGETFKLSEWDTDIEMQQAALLGGIMGCALGGLGNFAPNVSAKVKEKLPAETVEKIEQAEAAYQVEDFDIEHAMPEYQESAEQRAFNEQQTKGAIEKDQAKTEASKDIAKTEQRYLQNIGRNNQALAEARERAQNNLAPEDFNIVDSVWQGIANENAQSRQQVVRTEIAGEFDRQLDITKHEKATVEAGNRAIDRFIAWAKKNRRVSAKEKQAVFNQFYEEETQWQIHNNNNTAIIKALMEVGAEDAQVQQAFKEAVKEEIQSTAFDELIKSQERVAQGKTQVLNMKQPKKETVKKASQTKDTATVQETESENQAAGTPKQSARAEVIAAWNALKEINIISDPKTQAEKQMRLYKALVNLAREEITAGVKTVEEFAKRAGLQLNEAVRHAWESAVNGVGVEGDITIPDNARNSLGEIMQAEQANTSQIETVNLSDVNPVLEKILSHLAEVSSMKPLDTKALDKMRASKHMKLTEAFENYQGGDLLTQVKGLLKGSRDKVDIPILELSETEEALLNKYIASSDLQVYTKVNLLTGIDKLINGEWPTNYDLSLMEYAFGKDFVDMVATNVRKEASLYDNILSALGLPKIFKASVDLSAPVRQGGFFLAQYPKESWLAFKDMFSAIGDTDVSTATTQRIQKSKYFEQLQEAKVYFGSYSMPGETGVKGQLNQQEEQFMSTLAERIPVIGRLIAASERAYITFLDIQRIGVAESILEADSQAGVNINDSTYLKSLGKLINWGTGRGDLGRLSAVGKELNLLFFSPRFMTSRIQLPAYAMLNNSTESQSLRVHYFKTLGSFIGSRMALLGLLAMAGFKVGSDPRDPDFGKVKIGNTSIDAWGGFIQEARLIAQLVTNQYVDPLTGATREYDSRGQSLQRFLRGKDSPTAGIVADLLWGRTYEGEEMKLDSQFLQGYLLDIVSPMFVADMVEGWTQAGLLGVMTALPGGIGFGTTQYNELEQIVSTVYNENQVILDKEKQLNEMIIRKDKNGIEKFKSDNPDYSYRKDGSKYHIVQGDLYSKAMYEINLLKAERRKVEIMDIPGSEKKEKLKEIDIKISTIAMITLSQSKSPEEYPELFKVLDRVKKKLE